MKDVTDYERDFRRAGLPFFIEDYSATEDVFTRAAWLLALVFVGEMFGAINLNWPWYANVAAALGGLAFLLVAFGIANRVRGRPFRSLPESVGRVELVLFVLLPALLPLIFGGQWRSALVTAGGNLLLLLAIYAVVGYGLLSIVRWVAVRLVGELGASAIRLLRAVPLILGGAVILFLTTELWQVFAQMPTPFLIVLAAFFTALGTLFIAVRLPAEVERLEASEGGPPLTSRQRVNVGLVLFVSQALQVLLVSAAVGAFFVVLGAFAVSEDIRQAWLLGSKGNVLVNLPLLGHHVQITAELLRVSGGLAALAGLSYAVQMQTDETYRRLFLDEVTAEMRASFNKRADYLRLRYS